MSGGPRFFHAVFKNESDIIAATREFRKLGYIVSETYTPYAVHGLDTAQGLRKSRLPLLCLIFGVSGAVAKLWFQIWTSASSWPVNVGGKPLASVPAFVPVTFEITVLFAGVGTVLAFFFRSRLWPGRKTRPVHPRVTDDSFVLVLSEEDATFERSAAETIAARFNASETHETTEVAQ